jgi:hypothetical protein
LRGPLQLIRVQTPGVLGCRGDLSVLRRVRLDGGACVLFEAADLGRYLSSCSINYMISTCHKKKIDMFPGNQEETMERDIPKVEPSLDQSKCIWG